MMIDLLTISTRLQQLARGLDPTRVRLLFLAARRLASPILPREPNRERHALLVHLAAAWELLTVPGAECEEARAVVVRAFVDGLSELELGAIADSPACCAEWGPDLGLVDVDGDCDDSGVFSIYSWTYFGEDVAREIARRPP